MDPCPGGSKGWGVVTLPAMTGSYTQPQQLCRSSAVLLGFLGFAWLAPMMTLAQVRPITLNGSWSFRQAGTAAWHRAVVPGEVHTDLLRNGLIPDPYRNFNADSVQWVEEKDWEYRRTFTADEALLGNEHVDLVFKGLDTFAEVWLNDSLLGKADNMFRT